MPALYDSLVTTGLYFGSLFRNLSGVKGTIHGAGEVIGKWLSLMLHNAKAICSRTPYPSSHDEQYDAFILSGFIGLYWQEELGPANGAYFY